MAIFLASIGFSILYAIVVWTVGLDAMRPVQLPTEVMDTVTQRIVLFGLIVVLAPFAEEVFFRGFLLLPVESLLEGLMKPLLEILRFFTGKVALGAQLLGVGLADEGVAGNFPIKFGLGKRRLGGPLCGPGW